MGRKTNKKNTRQTESVRSVKGSFEITRSGMGFVITEKDSKDILIRPNDFNGALNGDMVKVKLKGDAKSGKRMTGVIVEILKRKQNEFIGRIDMSNGFGFFIADTDKRMPDIYIPGKSFNGAEDGDKVVVRITEWQTNTARPVGEVLSILNAEDENDFAMKSIILKSGFPVEFSDEVLEETARIPDKISNAEIKKRKDFRKTLTFTIDPFDAKDFDDAISFQQLENGNFEVGVHIADVSHYVEEGTELDKCAFERATSVYLPDRVNPMLPEHISNVLCSLRPNEDKLTFSAVFELTANGQVKNHWMGKTVIHSDHRFTYEEVQEIIMTKQGHLSEEIILLNDMAQMIRKKRFKTGAINFSSQEVKFKLDETGKPIGVMVKESFEAHQLIEEFMLLANRIVAESLSSVKIEKKAIPFPYRVHDTPDNEKLLPFIAFANKYGHHFDISSPEGIAKSFNEMLATVRGNPEQHVLEQLGIRTMAKAIYSSDNKGHYGLGFKHYCHFTSPIRRYPDIIVHRTLLSVLNEKPIVDKKMEEKCKHCSERERSAMESERSANKYKQVEYMQNFIGDEFEGIISGVSSFGFWVETVEHKCEGLVSLNSLMDFDLFDHKEEEYALVGKKSGVKFRMGDKITIKIIAANLEKRQLDYDWVITTALKEAKTVKGKAKKKK
jgi:ribonuclease R